MIRGEPRQMTAHKIPIEEKKRIWPRLAEDFRIKDDAPLARGAAAVGLPRREPRISVSLDRLLSKSRVIGSVECRCYRASACRQCEPERCPTLFANGGLYGGADRAAIPRHSISQ